MPRMLAIDRRIVDISTVATLGAMVVGMLIGFMIYVDGGRDLTVRRLWALLVGLSLVFTLAVEGVLSPMVSATATVAVILFAFRRSPWWGE